KDSHGMKQKFTASIWQEDEWFVAQCIEVDVASQGRTEDEAIDNLRDALELHFTPPVATVAPQIRALEIEVKAASDPFLIARSNEDSKPPDSLKLPKRGA